MEQLPVTAILPDLRDALAREGRAVLQAPPGAGKTTLVPLDLLASGLFRGRILMLEPRRLAARASAERMAETLGEQVGETVGYRIRGEAKVSAKTRIEVVTEGILTRMIQADPELPGIACVIFDEFHERSLQADLGLALVLEIRAALRPDLALLVMSATLDAAPVAALLDNAPMITAEGRAYPVETRWLPRPLDTSLRFDAAIAGLITQALDETSEGGLLAFLPGEGEIRRVEARLQGIPGIALRPLYGAMDFQAQRAALAPVPGQRRVVLATSIAETSLTLPDIRVVVDGGRARRARFDPASGMSRLVTERVTRAEAEQRRGRAGRVAAGICYRMWSKGEEGGLAAFPPPEIASADLTPLALELAEWGSDDLPFLTPPHPGTLKEARDLLTALGALDRGGSITDHGRQLSRLPVHPRLGHMLVIAGPDAAPLAALAVERDPMRGAGPDLLLRLKAIERPPETANRAVIERIRQEAKRLARAVPKGRIPGLSLAQWAALAWPDRIGLRRRGEAPRYLLSGGKGAVIEPGTALAKERLIVACDLDGDLREAGLRLGLAITEDELREVHGAKIAWSDEVIWNSREARVQALRRERFGALILTERPWTDAPPEALARAALAGLRENGLTWSPGAARLRARIALTRADDWPEVSDEALLISAEDWLLPHLGRARTLADLRNLDLTEALKAHIGWDRMAQTDRLAPAHFTTPLGRQVPIDYDGEHPAIEVRLQEMFGVTAHPVVGQNRQPLRITLLSPARRPVQVTLDLPGFWANSYADVRKDMRGEYPRHPWPEDPREAEPTLRAKPRS
ncbi:ATP-dependent helicase HrpB [Xinfangfangia sp. D13-10-4-6]|uniref:ATP-dependent helicase HrpB n=1 Tax=Pseudogemmobacter hezensis TaxID=2737662 RepID=UPI001552107C|nr:ATP-dependent helicase HrpB [Pseudogemmobacter hezensis]NPD17693.1 ATP-dependent helicase HrpB [Pseudogemmobacter hezensis]